MAIRVLVVDDDVPFRDAVTDLLAEDDRFEVVGAEGTAAEGLDAAVRMSPDLILMDVRMPGGGAPAAAVALTAGRRPGGAGSAPVVVALSAEGNARAVADMLRSGVTGYLLKGRLGTDLTDLMVRCSRGEVVLALPNGAEALRRVSGL